MSNSPYPLPAHAASIWLSGDDLWLGFSSTNDASKGHTIHLTIEGLGELLQLCERARDEAEPPQDANGGCTDAELLASRFAKSSIGRAKRTAMSLKLIADLLRARAAEPKARIAEAGAPIQAQILSGYGAALKRNADERAEAARQRRLRHDPEAFLADLGLLDPIASEA